MTRDLIIGGTGMLSALLARLASEERHISVISCSKDAFKSLSATLPPDSVTHLAVDYNDFALLEAVLKQSTKAYGLFDRAICWVHSPADLNVCFIVANYVETTFLHIMGSAAQDPSKPEIIWQWQKEFAQQFPNLDYKIAVLGFSVDNSTPVNSRWLTHSEISQGVYQALKNESTLNIVGTVTPWSLKP